MNELEMARVLKTIAAQTQSDLIVFFVVATIAMVLILIPIYGMILTDRKERRKAEQVRKATEGQAENERLDRYIQREAQIMQVIKENSEVIAGLKSTLDTSGISTNRSFDRIQERLDNLYKASENIRTELAVIHNLLDRNGA